MDGIWIMATFALAIVSVFTLLGIVFLWMAGRKEGRFMIRRGLGGKGVDLLLVEPSSNHIQLKTITWEGNIWKQDKEGMMMGLNLLSDPKTPSDKMYNELIKNTGTWGGNKRPVIMATPLMSTILPPGLIAAINKGEVTIKDDLIKNYVKLAEQHGLDVITHLSRISPTDIKKYLKDVGPKNIRDSFLKGVEAQKLVSTKPPSEKAMPGGLWVLLALMAVAFVILFYLIQSGTLDGFLETWL